MTQRSPQRFTPHAGRSLPSNVRRALNGAIDTDRRNNMSLDVDRDGRLGVNIAPGSVLKMTRRGLDIDQGAIGEKNREPLNHITNPDSAPTTAELSSKITEILNELRRTKHMRGMVQ